MRKIIRYRLDAKQQVYRMWKGGGRKGEFILDLSGVSLDKARCIVHELTQALRIGRTGW